MTFHQKKIIRAIAIGVALTTGLTRVSVPRLEAMMIPTESAHKAASIDREADMKLVRQTLESKVVRQRLADFGMNESEINNRLDKLNDQQIHRVAMHIEKQNPAGDAGGTVLIVIAAIALLALIISLLKHANDHDDHHDDHVETHETTTTPAPAPAAPTTVIVK